MGAADRSVSPSLSLYIWVLLAAGCCASSPLGRLGQISGRENGAYKIVGLISRLSGSDLYGAGGGYISSPPEMDEHLDL
jgi:hypothetical protein